MDLVGKQAPKFSLPNQDDQQVSLDDFKGKIVVLYFYPKDMTSGCTKESNAFQENLAEFEKAGAVVLGVSPDDQKSHTKFREKEGLQFDLLADTEKEVVDQYAVWKEKSMYGNKYMGVERSTFVIDATGEVVKEWRNVKVPGHVEEVLAYVQKLAS